MLDVLILIILFFISFICSIFMIFYLLLGFNFFKNILKKLGTNKKQIFLKNKLLYTYIDSTQSIKDIFTEYDIKLFEMKKIQNIRKQKLEKLRLLK